MKKYGTEPERILKRHINKKKTFLFKKKKKSPPISGRSLSRPLNRQGVAHEIGKKPWLHSCEKSELHSRTQPQGGENKAEPASHCKVEG